VSDKEKIEDQKKCDNNQPFISMKGIFVNMACAKACDDASSWQWIYSIKVLLVHRSICQCIESPLVKMFHQV